MLSPENSTQMTVPSLQITQSFLDKLAHDDHFRSELEADPQQALARFNIFVDPAQIPDRVALPDKTTLQAISPTGPGDPSGDAIKDHASRWWAAFLS